MVDIFNELLTKAFDKNVPMRKIKIYGKYVIGLSEETKASIKERNKARKHHSNQYKTLRNEINKLIITKC